MFDDNLHLESRKRRLTQSPFMMIYRWAKKHLKNAKEGEITFVVKHGFQRWKKYEKWNAIKKSNHTTFLVFNSQFSNLASPGFKTPPHLVSYALK